MTYTAKGSTNLLATFYQKAELTIIGPKLSEGMTENVSSVALKRCRKLCDLFRKSGRSRSSFTGRRFPWPLHRLPPHFRVGRDATMAQLGVLIAESRRR